MPYSVVVAVPCRSILDLAGSLVDKVAAVAGLDEVVEPADQEDLVPSDAEGRSAAPGAAHAVAEEPGHLLDCHLP